MYRILIVSEDFVLRKAVAFSLNDLDACVECADTVGAMLVLHRESPFDLVIVIDRKSTRLNSSHSTSSRMPSSA